MADMAMPEGDEATTQIWQAFQAMGPMLDRTLQLSQNAPPKRQRKGDSNRDDHQKPGALDKIQLAQAVTLMAKLALQMDRDLQAMKREDTFILFFANKGKESSLQTLLQATEQWAKQFQENQTVHPKGKIMPLRQHLAQVLFNTLLSRIQQLGSAKEGSEILLAAQHNQVLLQDRTCPYLEWDHGQTASHPDQTPTDLSGHAGNPDGGADCGEISCTASRTETRGLTMEAASEPAPGQPMATADGAEPLSHLAAHGHITPSPQPAAKPSCSEPPEDLAAPDIPQGEWQRQETRHSDTQEGVMPAELPTSPAPDSLLLKLAHMTMENPGNICFANATTSALLWTTLSNTKWSLKAWGKQCQMLHDFICTNPDTCKNLCMEEWFQQILHCWGLIDPATCPQRIAQQDSTEFVTTWLEQMDSDAFDMRWEKRILENTHIRIFDHGCKSTPICLKFPQFLADFRCSDLTQLFDAWRQADGMCTALCQAPTCLCIHVDRYAQDDQQQIYKSECMLQTDQVCLVPVFKDDTLTCEMIEYQVVALTEHLGLDNAGHFRSALRLAPAIANQVTPAEWLLTDDWVAPKPMWDVPNWMKRTATVYWLTRSDEVKLWKYRNMDTKTDAEAVNAAILAMLPMPK